ncbi:MAG: hypothetical protein H6849_03735 [Alphaproteobacteria bacterium]|nr:MAG: hypothetical protein H6849_03735 [Alphaproteobacteria bacterium]
MNATMALVVLISGVAFGLFTLKYKVSSLEDEHRQINQKIRQHTNSIRILKAEANYLSSPTRMQHLARAHTQLQPIKPSQIFLPSEITFVTNRRKK